MDPRVSRITATLCENFEVSEEESLVLATAYAKRVDEWGGREASAEDLCTAVLSFHDRKLRWRSRALRGQFLLRVDAEEKASKPKRALPSLGLYSVSTALVSCSLVVLVMFSVGLFLAIAAFIYVAPFLFAVGLALAVLSLRRRERPSLVALLGVIMNGAPLVGYFAVLFSA